MKKTVKIFILVFICSGALFAQRPGGGGGPGKGPGGKMPQITLKGQVIDKDTKQGLEFATISISTIEGDELIGGGITEAEGVFMLTTRPGKLKAKIEYISYESIIVSPIPFEKGVPVIDLGVLEMGISGEVIEGVEIRAEKSETSFKLDKKVFTVGKDLANRGGGADEVLDNVPSVTVDLEGNVSLRGSGNVRMLINGQPSSILSNGNLNGLKSIQANDIDRIEVITNPSAKYEAAGMAGIVNIILKKEDRKGFNGAFNLGLGLPWQYNFGAQLNYRKGRSNFFVNVSSGVRVRPGLTEEYSRQRIEDAFRRSYLTNDRERRGVGNRIRGGMDFNLTENQVITFTGSFGLSDNNNISTVNYLDSLETNSNVDFFRNLQRIDNETEDGLDQEYSLKYINNFGGEDQELVAFIRYDERGDREFSTISQEINNELVDRFQEVDIDEKQTNKLAQLDYSKKLKKDYKIETGLRTNLRTIINNYKASQQIDGVLTELTGLSDDFEYNENIYAAYGTISKTWAEKFSLQVGARLEHTEISTAFVNNTDQDTAYNYLKLFPSAFFTYNINEKNAIQLSYSKRIQRPRFWYLNPFLTLSDDRNLFAGNPKLLPEYTDSYELGYIRYLENGSLSSSIFYKYTTDVIQRLRNIRTDGTTVTYPVNLTEEFSYGLEFSTNYNVTKWLTTTADVTFFNYNASADDVENAFDAADVSWFGRVGIRAKFLKNASLQSRFNYRAPRANIQGQNTAMYSLDFGLSKDFLKNNLTVTLSSRDLLNTRKRNYIIDLQPDYFAEGSSQWRGRTIDLNLSYRVNQKKKRGGNREGGGFEGEEGGF